MMKLSEAIASLKTLCNTCKFFPQCAYKKPECFKAIEMAISALEKKEKEDKWYDEWCNGCPAYDEEGHCCPRFNKVIRSSVEKMQEQDRWIPVTERLPEKPYGCLVTVWDTNPMTQEEFEKILPYFIGWDGEQWNDADGDRCPFEVIAWRPLPEPYQEEE